MIPGKSLSASKGAGRSLLLELLFVTAAMLVLAHFIFLLRPSSFLGSAVSSIFGLLLLYTPVLVMWIKKRPIDFFDRGWRSYAKSFLVFMVASAIVFPLFLLGAHVWQTSVMGFEKFHFATIPNFWNFVLVQLALVALPEEFYFRGYFQSTIGRVFEKRWRILGVNLGWGWVITAAVFAFAHSVVYYQWWHFSIFFPALLFGYLRERTGSITAPILFHAASNIAENWISRCY